MTSYNINKMSEVTGLSPHTLRYYEKEFMVLDVSRDASGHRYYSENHVKAIHFISALRRTGMPIREIKRYIELYKSGSSTVEQRLDLLKQHEQRVEEDLKKTQQSLLLIQEKIQHYHELYDL